MITRILYQPSVYKSVASLSDSYMEGRVVIYDHAQKQIQKEINLPQNCGRAFCLSNDGKYLATGYWYKKGIDIWDIESNALLHTIGPSNVSGVLFDKTVNFIIYHSDSGTYAHAINESSVERIYHCEGIGESSFNDSNELFIPINRKGKYALVNFESLSSRVVDLNLSAKLHWIRHSPDNKSFFVIDSQKNIYCFGEKTKAIKWKISLKKQANKDFIKVGTYSGDGELIGITVTENSGFRTIVLDSKNGEIRNVFPEKKCSGYPFIGKEVINESGEIINLEDGSISPGISHVFA
jgi:WD40 repeat protein